VAQTLKLNSFICDIFQISQQPARRLKRTKQLIKSFNVGQPILSENLIYLLLNKQKIFCKLI